MRASFSRSQAALHAPWGGVVPALARRAHEEAITPMIEQALAAAGLAAGQLTAVAVTVGPGLSPCLRVGVAAARALAAQHQLPLVPVHHMEARGCGCRHRGHSRASVLHNF